MSKEEVMHMRMHVGENAALSEALQVGFGMKSECTKNQPCDSCVKAKATKLPVSKTHKRKATYAGQQVVYDLMVVNKHGYDNELYVLVMVDVYSNYVWALPLKSKGSVSEMVQYMVKAIEKHTAGKQVCRRCVCRWCRSGNAQV